MKNVQFASSCPGDIGFLRQSNPVHHPWYCLFVIAFCIGLSFAFPLTSCTDTCACTWDGRVPSPRALDEFDLSKSPALSVMSASRDGRAPINNFRHVGQSRSYSSSSRQQQPNRNRFPPNASRPYYPDSGVLSHTELMEHLSITEEEQSFSDDSSDYNHSSNSSHLHPHHSQHSYRPPQTTQQSQSPYDRRERRGSYGSLSDNGDGGVFHFEES